MEENIWYFENSELGVVVRNVEYFVVYDDHVRFRFVDGKYVTLEDREDVSNFKRNILRIG